MVIKVVLIITTRGRRSEGEDGVATLEGACLAIPFAFEHFCRGGARFIRLALQTHMSPLHLL